MRWKALPRRKGKRGFRGGAWVKILGASPIILTPLQSLSSLSRTLRNHRKPLFILNSCGRASVEASSGVLPSGRQHLTRPSAKSRLTYPKRSYCSPNLETLNTLGKKLRSTEPMPRSKLAKTRS